EQASSLDHDKLDDDTLRVDNVDALRYWLRYRIRWSDLKAFTRYLIERFQRHHCLDSAAALTLATLFALVPTLAVLYSILAMIPSLRGVGEVIQGWAFEQLVPTTGDELQGYLVSFAEQAKRLTSIGIAMLFVTAIGMLRRIEKVFNRIWCVQNPRQGVMSFLRYWAVLSLGPILLGLGLVVTSYVTSVKLFADTLKLLAVQKWGLTLLPFVTSWLSFSLLNWVVPNRKVPFTAASAGGLVSAVGFEAAKRLFGVFVTQFPSYQLVYGAFAFFPLFIIWLYLSWIIVLMGAIVARGMTVYRAESRGVTPWCVAVFDVLHLFWRARQVADVVTAETACQQLEQLSPEDWENISRRLLLLGWIQRTTEDAYLFTGEFKDISVNRVLCDVCDLPEWGELAQWMDDDRRDTWRARLRHALRDLDQAQDAIMRVSLCDLFVLNVAESSNAAAIKQQ
ncbi:MAG: YihY family inner membrane protein, partial [Gammaproteobacteria bacterium]